MSPILGIWASSRPAITPDTGAMFPLQVITVGPAGASSVSFTNIPNTYSHLQVRFLVKTDRGAVNDAGRLRINNDTTGSNYRSHSLNANGASVYAETTANVLALDCFPGGTNANMFGVGVIDILDYASTNKNKTIRLLGGFDQNSTSTGSAWIGISSGLWMNSSTAITSLQIDTQTSSNLLANSQFALYGVKTA